MSRRPKFINNEPHHVTESYSEEEAEEALNKVKTYTPAQHAADLRAAAEKLKKSAVSGSDIVHLDAWHMHCAADYLEQGDHGGANNVVFNKMDTAGRDEVPPHVYLHLGGTILTRHRAFDKNGPVAEGAKPANEAFTGKYTGQHSTTANAGYGFHGEMYNDHEEGKKSDDASPHAARQFALMHKHLVTVHGVDPKIARNLLDSKYGRWMADSIRGNSKSGHTVGKPLTSKACEFAVNDNFRAPDSLDRAIGEIEKATKQGRFEESVESIVEGASPLPAPVTPEGFTHTVRFHLEPQFSYKNKAERSKAEFEDDANRLHDHARDNGIALADHNGMGKYSVGRPSEKPVTYHPAHGSSYSTYEKNGEVSHRVSEERPHHYVDVHVKGADVARAFGEAGGHMMKSLASETYKNGKRVRVNTDDYMNMRAETHGMEETGTDKKAEALKVVENDANGYLKGIMPNGDANTGVGFQVLPHIHKNISGHVAKLKKDLGLSHADALAAVAGHYDAASANCAKSGDKRGAYCLSKMADHTRGLKETTAESVLGRPDQTKATVSVLTNNKILHVGQPGVHMAHFHLKDFDKLNRVAAAPGGMAELADDTGRSYNVTHDEDGVMRFGSGSSGQFFVHAEKVRKALAPHIAGTTHTESIINTVAATAKLIKG